MKSEIYDARRELESEFEHVFYHDDEAHITIGEKRNAIILRKYEDGAKVLFNHPIHSDLTVGQAWAISSYLAALGLSPGAPR